MEPYGIFFLVLGLVILGGTLSLTMARPIQSRREKAVFGKIQRIFPAGTITSEAKKPFQYLIETDSTVYLVKMIWMNPMTELIVTNPDFWCVNANPGSWNRSSSPVLIPGVKAFREWTEESPKKVVKLGLICPGCQNISRYLNESEVEMVKITTDVFGCRLVRLGDLEVFFAKVEKK